MRKVCAVILGLAAVGRVYSAPDLVEALRNLPPGHVLLGPHVLGPSRFHATDNAGTCESLPADGAFPRLRIDVSRKTPNSWDVGMSWACPEAVAKDDVLLLTLRARATHDSAHGQGEIRAVFRRQEKPYNHSLNTVVRVGRAWQQIALPFSPSVATEADGARVIVNFGLKKQTLEIEGLCLMSFGKAVSLSRLHRLFGTKPDSAGRKAVGSALTPQLLFDMDAYQDLPAADPAFNPSGAWTHTYTIWTCHGYRASGNKVVGSLLVARTPGPPPVLTVEQEIANDQGVLHGIKATITCADDSLCSPAKWDLESTYTGPDGEAVDDLCTREAVRHASGQLTLTIGERVVQRAVATPATADWCLFDAVQRLPFDQAPEVTFCMLEGLGLRKDGQRLAYKGAQDVAVGGKVRTLHRFRQIGHGVLPYDYWLDDTHRLLMVITHSRAYILDPAAPEKVARAIGGQRASSRRERARREKEEAQ